MNIVLTPQEVLVFTGSGISAPSGIPTFRDANGLWGKFRIEDVATPEAWARNPQMVLDFYNMRRAQAASVQPNAGHLAIAELERYFNVTVVTQNVDDLHERAGSSRVIHLHGELRKARSTKDPELIYDIGGAPIQLGDLCELGSQLRPHIVWFGEAVPAIDGVLDIVSNADRVLVVGTSLMVYPAAGLLDLLRADAIKVLVDLQAARLPDGFRFIQGSADVALPKLVEEWTHGRQRVEPGQS